MTGRMGLVCALALAGSALADGVPAEWTSIRKAEIAAWKAQAPEGVKVDERSRTVTFLAEATGVTAADTLEFLAIGPLSDRAYESLTVSVASPAAIAAALEKVGVPRGLGVAALQSRFWPQGERVSMTAKVPGEGKTLALGDLLADTRAKEETPVLAENPVATLGARAADGSVVAATNIPCAVFALYGNGPSLLQFDGAFDQSSVYGRFRAARALKAGTLIEFTLGWSGTRRVRERTLTVEKTSNMAALLAGLRAEKDAADLYVRLACAADLPLVEAARAAHALLLVDGHGIRMNGCAPGQFFYRAYLPDPAWRQREGRIFQPFEVHLAADGTRTFVYVEEDFSGSGVDPVLKPHATPFKDWSDLPALIAKTCAAKVDVLFLFAPPETPVGTLLPVQAPLAGRIHTFYVFPETTVTGGQAK